MRQCLWLAGHIRAKFNEAEDGRRVHEARWLQATKTLEEYMIQQHNTEIQNVRLYKDY